MKRILHTADWHIGNFPGPEIGGQNLRALDTINCIQSMIDCAADNCPDVILVSGDILHQARVWADRGLSEVKTAIGALEALSKIAPVVLLRGTLNHDGEEQYELLKTHFATRRPINVYIITEPDIVHFGDLHIACLPGFDRGAFRAKFPGLSKEEENQVFTEELGKIVLGLKAKCNPDCPSVLMAHYTVSGCNTESGQTQFLAQYEPVIMPEVLDAAGFDLVALGHIHKPQQVPSCRHTFYSGAINALNFNDEGQERGFWIHEIEPDLPFDRLINSAFRTTPAREFLTIRWGAHHIQKYLAGVAMRDMVAVMGDLSGKIVRVLYSCTDEDNKALNRAVMEKELYDLGAFWVSEISPEKITTSTNKNELSEKTDPEANLINYLNEKAVPYDKVGPIVEAARPIIAEATAQNAVARHSGAFVPLEIEVKNYRNYEAERFDFGAISFCTINGKNGAGKSSLFMDAILDCLYEEPREGDLTGWIRADEKARSGSISFTFAIGDRTFRVTRTRAKSGKATLTLSELVDGEWANRSAEKIKDTQERIIEILGMDSLTFRSCALIMQDQYGLFLEANKEDRMSILGNILGLGIYNDMEQLARSRAKDVNRIITQKKQAVELLSNDILGEPDLRNQLATSNAEVEQLQLKIQGSTANRDNIRLQLATKQEAAARAAKIKQDLDALEIKAADIAAQIEKQEAIITEADALLNDEDTILELAGMYPQLLKEEKAYLTKYATLKEKLSSLTGIGEEAQKISTEIAATETEQVSATQRITSYKEQLQREPELKKALDRLKKEKAALEAMESRSELYIALSNDIAELNKEYSTKLAAFEAEAAKRKATIETLQSKAGMLENSKCIDPGNATCVFLADAKKAKDQLEDYRKECTDWKKAQQDALEEVKRGADTLLRQREELGYDPDALKKRRAAVASLEELAKEYEKLGSIRQHIALLEERLTSLDTSIASARERLAQVLERAQEAKRLAEEKQKIERDHLSLKGKLMTAETWMEKEKQLPVAKERKATAAARIEELTKEHTSVLSDIGTRSEEYHKELAQADTKDLDIQLTGIEELIANQQNALSAMQMEIGRLQHRLEEIANKKAEISAIQVEINTLSEQASRYETLKAAFSQDGIPHNIIRSMLPRLTATANNILGQMTGGKMGMEFITDKVLKSNNKKEVPTLDIVIEEYGKDTLPYLSKSGGEKVKAALSAILSLAEIKSSQAGIQLGMLFIDEPPFLDADGIQAYCDALETIQARYSNLKVMAITHDPTMKARFPQNIDVVKTDAGSKIELG